MKKRRRVDPRPPERASAFYWVKPYPLSGAGYPLWVIAQWADGAWYFPGNAARYEGDQTLIEVDERPIDRPPALKWELAGRPILTREPVTIFDELFMFCRLFRLAWRAYRISRNTGGSGYAAWEFRGVPTICVLVGTGREAWRITQHAIETFEMKERKL